MKVRIGMISFFVSFRIIGDSSSGPVDFLVSRLDRGMRTPGEVTSKVP